ncbi:monovalent cation/H+ antiporter complex subunit F [Pseudokineococcus sp. 1T1Z-3]|uniref:monovalent cation/H+ antiporter complex subunit F n=1 Tax=Pseudokineococcus sp. 1T1Z-3 TaxID=3132745 RepID=UPI0030A8F1FC
MTAGLPGSLLGPYPGLDVALVLVLVALAAAVVRLLRSDDDAGRVLAGDLVYFCVLGLIALLGVRVASTATFDLVLVGTLVGLLSSVSLARLLTRGRR